MSGNDAVQLPELPAADYEWLAAGSSIPMWSANKMRTYALAALASQPRVDAGAVALTVELKRYGDKDWQVYWAADTDDAKAYGRPLYFRNFKVGDKIQLYTTPPTPSGNAALVALIEKLEQRASGFRSSEYGIGKQDGIKECLEDARAALAQGVTNELR